MGGAGTSGEVGGITQPMLSEALPPNTIIFDPGTAANDLDRLVYSLHYGW